MQVVHLYQELRKMMGDDFMVRDMNSQDSRESMLHGIQPYQALTAADEQARQRRLAEDYNAVQVWRAPLLLQAAVRVRVWGVTCSLRQSCMHVLHAALDTR